MTAHGPGGDPAPTIPPGAASTRRLLAACCALLAGFALLLLAATLVGARLRSPLGRIPVATYAARRGVVLPAEALATPGDRPGGRVDLATATTGRRPSAPGTATPISQAPSGAAASPAAEVTAAYLHAWALWAEACLTLDPAPLAGGFAPPELDRARVYVRQLGESGRALRLDAAHRVTVLELDGDTALLLDELTDRSRYLDPVTHQPLPVGAQPTPVGAERVYSRLRRTTAGWRVADITWGR